MTMRAFTYHPIAAIFPLLDEHKLAELTADIKANGLKQDITLYEGMILDGRNRYRACLQADVLPTFHAYAGDDPVGHVLSLNLHRRHLTASQLAMVGTESLPHYEVEAKKRKVLLSGTRANPGEVVAIVPQREESAKARDQAAAAVGVSPRYVSDAKRLKAESPDLAEKVKSGELSLPKAIEALLETKDPEQEPTKPEPAKKIVITLAEGRRIWEVAKMKLNTIDRTDSQRAEVLNEVIAYAQKRLLENL